MGGAAEPPGLSVGLGHLHQIRPEGHELHSHRAADELFLRVHDLPVSFVLIGKFRAWQHGQYFLRRKIFALFEQSIRGFRPTIFESLEGIVGRVLDHLFAGELEDLGVRWRAGNQSR